jgi:hypothetical protein
MLITKTENKRFSRKKIKIISLNPFFLGIFFIFMQLLKLIIYVAKPVTFIPGHSGLNIHPEPFGIKL